MAAATEWHKQLYFGFTGIYRKPPAWITGTILRANPLFIFQRKFDGSMSEPEHELYTKPNGQVVHIYPLDIHDDLIPIITGLLLQFPIGQLTDEDECRELYADLVKKLRCVTYIGFKYILRYYGIMPEEEEDQQEKIDEDDDKLTLEQIAEKPTIVNFKRFARHLIEHTLTQSPDWPKFASGIHTCIEYQFASPHNGGDSDYAHKFRFAIGDNEGRFYYTNYFLRQEINGNEWNSKRMKEAIIAQALKEYNEALVNCKASISIPYNNTKPNRLVKCWPLTHEFDPILPDGLSSAISHRKLPAKTYLPNNYRITTLTLSW